MAATEIPQQYQISETDVYQKVFASGVFYMQSMDPWKRVKTAGIKFGWDSEWRDEGN